MTFLVNVDGGPIREVKAATHERAAEIAAKGLTGEVLVTVANNRKLRHFVVILKDPEDTCH